MRVIREINKEQDKDIPRVTYSYIEHLKKLMFNKEGEYSRENSDYEAAFRREMQENGTSHYLTILSLGGLIAAFIGLFINSSMTLFTIPRLIAFLISISIFIGLFFAQWFFKKFRAWKFNCSVSALVIHIVLGINVINEAYQDLGRDLAGFSTNNNLGSYSKSYFWYCFMLSNLMSHSLLTFDCYFRYTFPSLLLCNVAILICLNLIINSFILETLSIILFSVFLFLTVSKLYLIFRRIYTKYLYYELKHRFHGKFIDSISVGHCVIAEDLSINFMNPHFTKNFQILVDEEDGGYEHINSEVIHLEMSHGDHQLDNNQEAFTCRGKSFRSPFEYKRKLNSDILIKKGENSDLDVTSQTLTDEIRKYIKLNQDTNNIDIDYTFLNKFKIYKNNPKMSRKTRNILSTTNQNYDIYDIYIRKNIFDFNEQSYDILFIGITNCPKIEKMKIDKNYKMLMLAKISHEFKYPLMLIQNHIDNMTDNRMYAINTYESYSQIRYLAEVLMLSILDLSQYVNERQEPINSNYSYSLISIWSLKEYLYNLTKVLMIVYNKNLNFKVVVEKNLESFKFTNDEKKLKQILFNLISNAIKNTIDGEITISMSQKFSRSGSRLLSIGRRTVVNSPQLNKTLPDNAPENIVLSQHCISEQESKITSEDYTKHNLLAITIEDTGCGLRHNLLDMINGTNINESFMVRKNSIIKNNLTYTSNKGLGIGLVICKKLCSELNMSLSAELNKLPDTNITTGTKVTLNIKDKLSKTNTVSVKTLEHDNNRSVFVMPSDKNLVYYEINQENESFHETNEEIQIVNNKTVLNTKILESLKVRNNELRRNTQSRVTTSYYQNLDTNSGTLISNNMRLSSIGGPSVEPTCLCMKFFKDNSTNMTFYPVENSLGIINNSGTFYDRFPGTRPASLKLDKKHTTGFNKRLSIENQLETIKEIKRKEKKQKSVKHQSKLNLKTEKYLGTLTSIISEKESTNNLKNESPKSKIKYSFDPNNSSSSSHFSEEIAKPKLKFLVVDDNRSNQLAIEKLILRYYDKKRKEVDVVVKSLDDGIELLNEVYNDLLIGNNSIKMIFCDQMMNYMNGSEAFTIVSKIFKEKNIREIPFVICSAFNDEGHYNKMKALGIELIFEKPLSYGNMEYILDSHVSC